ncbi:MAG: RNA 2',3'-cyclic phosphodiesterase [Deltaproteobacteria bacterium]|nr:RNA 2',3'-cyclic phosphodiesterase [Deltaproteobacteria bacterium]
MLRTFLAIDLPGSVRPALAQVQEELRRCGADVRWVPVGNIHLTLKFFGEIAEARVEPLCAAAGEVAARQASFRLQLTGAGAFPSLKNPRVVWMGVGGDLPVVGALHRQLEAAFEALGFPREGRPFAPHLTLGRVKSPRGRERLTDCLSRLVDPETPPFPVSEIILYRSILSPQGATYVPLKVITLGG